MKKIWSIVILIALVLFASGLIVSEVYAQTQEFQITVDPESITVEGLTEGNVVHLYWWSTGVNQPIFEMAMEDKTFNVAIQEGMVEVLHLKDDIVQSKLQYTVTNGKIVIEPESTPTSTPLPVPTETPTPTKEFEITVDPESITVEGLTEGNVVHLYWWSTGVNQPIFEMAMEDKTFNVAIQEGMVEVLHLKDDIVQSKLQYTVTNGKILSQQLFLPVISR